MVDFTKMLENGTWTMERSWPTHPVRTLLSCESCQPPKVVVDRRASRKRNVGAHVGARNALLLAFPCKTFSTKLNRGCG